MVHCFHILKLFAPGPVKLYIPVHLRIALFVEQKRNSEPRALRNPTLEEHEKMRHKWLIASILIVALIGICGASLFATWQGIRMARSSGARFVGWDYSDRVSVQETQEKKLTVEGPVNLSVKTFQGNITVRTGKAGEVAVKSEIIAWGDNKEDAQAALKDTKVIIDQSAKDIHISVDQVVVADMLHIGPRGGRVNFTLTVPPDTAVTLDSAQGDLSLSGTTGNADLETEFGNLSVVDVTGDVSASSGSGKITARNIESTGNVKLSSEFGGTTAVENIRGKNVTISSSNGHLTGLSTIHASELLKINTSFGDIQLIEAQAKTADIKSRNGAVELEKTDVKDLLTVKSDFGNLTLQQVSAGSYDLDTKNGKISVDGAQNELKAHSDFGSITVLNARNATIDLSSKNGGLTFSGSLGDGPHILHSDFGNIKITLPEESKLNLDLQTDFGKISSSFSITVNGDMDSRHWTGSINGGGATLTIDTKNGNISLQSAK
jgi:DUF4097 and DUF4098 domain-containing protein YvlB